MFVPRGIRHSAQQLHLRAFRQHNHALSLPSRPHYRPSVVAAQARQTHSHVATFGSPPAILRILSQSTLSCAPNRSTRHYWWSSKSTLPPDIPPAAAKAPQNDPIEEPVKSESSIRADDSRSDTPGSGGEGSPVNEEAVVNSTPDLSADASELIPPPPIQLGDLKELGFCNYTPVGAAQATLEFIHVQTGLPWWGTITLTTVLARIAISYFTVKSTRMAAKMAPFRPQMDALMKEINDAKAAGDRLRMQVHVLKLAQLRRDNGLGIGAAMGGPVSQALLSISMFIGIKKLCDLPVPQLKYESVGWLTSLSAPDPLYILPALSVAIVNLQLQLGKAEMAASGSHMLHFVNFFRVLSLVFFPVVAKLPSGLLLHIVVNVVFVALQSRVLRTPAVRQRLNIPPLPVLAAGESPSMRDTWNVILKWFADKRTEAAQQARQRANIPTFPAHSTSSSSSVHRTPKRDSKRRKH